MKKNIMRLILISIFITGMFMTTGCGIKDNNISTEEDEKINIIDDNKSYFIIIDGKKFTAGDKIKDLSSVGYTLKSSEVNEELPSNKYMIGAGHMMNSENRNIFNVTPYNIDNSSKKISEVVIGGIEISYNTAKYDKKSENFEVYGGIKLGSTIEEVKKIFGEPSSVSELSTITVYRYKSEETYRNYEFTFNDEKQVTKINWQNLVFNK